MASAITILGCPYSSFIALNSACPITAAPACATAANPTYDAACCGSLSSFGSSIGSCYIKNAPSCLDTAAALSSLSGTESLSNPCAAFATGGAGGAGGSASSTPSSSAATTTAASSGASSTSGSSSSASPAGTASGSSSAATGTSAGAASGTSGAAAASSTKPSSAHKVGGAGLKAYLGVALLGAMFVIAL